VVIETIYSLVRKTSNTLIVGKEIRSLETFAVWLEEIENQNTKVR
jgi:hypothetical protein